MNATHGQNCCRVCGSELSFKKYISGEESGKNIALNVCRKCKSCFTRIEFEIQNDSDVCGEDISGYLHSEQYVKSRVSDILSTSLENHWIFENGFEFLDIGCGVGWSLDVAQRKGFNSIGVEPVRAASEYANNILKVNVVNSLFNADSFEGKQFDFVMMDQVLEHVPNPVAFLKDAFSLLKEGGVFFLSVPPIDWSRRLTSISYLLPTKMASSANKWAISDSITNMLVKYDSFRFPEGHINYFSDRAIKLLAEQCGAEVIGQYHLNRRRGKLFPMLNLTTGSYFLRKNPC